MFNRKFHGAQTINLELSDEISQFSCLSEFACQARIVSPGKLKASAGKILSNNIIPLLFTEAHTQALSTKETVCSVFCLNSQLLNYFYCMSHLLCKCKISYVLGSNTSPAAAAEPAEEQPTKAWLAATWRFI